MEYRGSRYMDKVDICLITLIYLIQMTLAILSIVMYLIPPPSTIGREFRNRVPWEAILSLHTTKFTYTNFKTIGDIIHLYVAISSNFLSANSIDYRDNRTEQR